MKIAFIGSHGVGKTTLCFEVAARLKRLDMSVDVVKEVARLCPLPINQKTTLDAQAWILHRQISEEIAADNSFEAVVCDRSVLDNYAYLVHKMGRRSELDPLVASWVRSYQGLFKVPITMAPTFDGTRDVNELFQHEIDQLIDELIDEFSVDCRLLPPEDRDLWPEHTLKALGLPTEPPQINLFTGRE